MPFRMGCLTAGTDVDPITMPLEGTGREAVDPVNLERRAAISPGEKPVAVAAATVCSAVCCLPVDETPIPLGGTGREVVLPANLERRAASSAGEKPAAVAAATVCSCALAAC